MTSFTQGQNDFIPSSSLDRCYNYRWVGYVPGYKGERLTKSLHQERGWFGVSTVQFNTYRKRDIVFTFSLFNTHTLFFVKQSRKTCYEKELNTITARYFH